MQTLKQLLKTSLISVSLTSVPAFADWSLNNQQSSVHFISVKKQHIAETHHFKQLSATLKNDGQFSLSIDLASAETGIDIRNTRMREQLFKVGTYADAKITAQLPVQVMKLKQGQSIQADLSASLNLMETTSPLTLNVQVTKTQEGDYIATSIQPILISAANVGLKEGVETLQKLAGLPSIGLTVPVSFNLVLKAN